MKGATLPLWVIVLILVGAVLYLINPVDLVPDFIPLLGRLDDLLLLALAFYLSWKRKKKVEGAFRSGPRRPRTGPSGPEPAVNPAGEDDPYALLGTDSGAGEAAIKKAYRRALGKYHPDRVQHLGEEFRKMAAEKTIAINRAYERIKKERGFT